MAELYTRTPVAQPPQSCTAARGSAYPNSLSFFIPFIDVTPAAGHEAFSTYSYSPHPLSEQTFLPINLFYVYLCLGICFLEDLHWHGKEQGEL